MWEFAWIIALSSLWRFWNSSKVDGSSRRACKPNFSRKALSRSFCCMISSSDFSCALRTKFVEKACEVGTESELINCSWMAVGATNIGWARGNWTVWVLKCETGKRSCGWASAAIDTNSSVAQAPNAFSMATSPQKLQGDKDITAPASKSSTFALLFGATLQNHACRNQFKHYLRAPPAMAIKSNPPYWAKYGGFECVGSYYDFGLRGTLIASRSPTLRRS